jgi:DNA invertase Pin-like site-specific DNA recombinase
MKQLFAYIRVSTAKQGQGVSLQEQRSAIERFAARTGAQLTQWFEERKTAAKAGRPEFARMMKLLRGGKAHGVVIHKIDRSTRNYRDWADIDELIEGGIDVFFANEDVDLRSRGGRLAADIQMVVAVDYIRNLREEALKGIHGRLKQGILPHGAPIGYLDRGAGQPKVIDPERGPIIRRLFEEYATGRATLRDLTVDAERLGLRNRNGKALRLTQIQKMVRNAFYSGVIVSKRHGVFRGAHEALIKPALFDRVQAVLDGKLVRRTKRFAFPFRRLIHCRTCRRSLVGSERKGFTYYRCQVPECPTTSLREDVLDRNFRETLHSITLSDQVVAVLENEILRRLAADGEIAAARRLLLEQTLGSIEARLNKLTDLLIDGNIDPRAHDEKRAHLLIDRARIEQELSSSSAGTTDAKERIDRVLELVRSASSMYERADGDQKRDLITAVIEDCTASGKEIAVVLQEPFAAIARRQTSETEYPPISADQLITWSLRQPKNLGLEKSPSSLIEMARLANSTSFAADDASDFQSL